MERRNTRLRAIDLLGEFLAEKRAEGLAEKTLRGYENELTEFAGELMVNELTKAYLTEKTCELQQRMKPISVNHYVRCYRTFLYWLMENEYIPAFKIKPTRYQEEPVELYTQEDLEKLLEKPGKHDSFATWRTWAMIGFVMGTGARIGTLNSMLVSDVNLAEREAVYRHEKNKKSSTIPLCEELVKMLSVYIREFALTELLFPADGDYQLSVYANKHAFERYCQKRGVKYRGFHRLRHNFAKAFIVNGGDCFKLKKMLDHSSLAMSEHYAHVYGTDLHKAVNDFSALSTLKKR